MTIFVTGASGFVGRHVVSALLARGHAVTAVARDEARLEAMPWAGQVTCLPCDLHGDISGLLAAAESMEGLIHLAWPGLPNYNGSFHLTQNLPADIRFLSGMVKAGLKRLVVAGTCLEYGIQFGPLHEAQETKPGTPYGLAKDALRKTLQQLQREFSYDLKWMRLFYMYGEGQNPRSLLAQLDQAIESGAPSFNMSAGDQLRDYLPVSEIAQRFVRALEAPEVQGVVNCCSGKPTAVIDLVQSHCAARGSTIALNRGHYPYPDYEAMAFWGVSAQMPPDSP